MSVATDVAEAKQTIEFDAVAWKRAVGLVSDVAYLKLTDKDVQGRIGPATALALSRDKVRYDEGVHYVAGSQGTHTVDAKSCDCEDFVYGKAPKGLCKHRLAVMLVMRAARLTPAQITLTPAQLKVELEQQAEQHKAEQEQQAPSPPPEGEPEEAQAPGAVDEEAPEPDVAALPEPEAVASVPHGIDPRWIQNIQGKDFVKYEGLLVLAHERGLQSLTVAWTYNDPELSLAHATAVFPFGTFTESGDASPGNVTKKVAPHFRRVALTRAKARALRDALNIGLVAVEELD